MSNIPEIMAKKACEIRKNAYAPYSNFKVGACVRSEDGEFFVGCNIENAAYTPTVHAEGAAITALICAGKKRITALAVAGSGDILCTPCGLCRQTIREFAALDIPIYLVNPRTEKVVKTMTLEELLPLSFGPDNLESNKGE
jgi:cytidine deaminase